ncbi:FAD-dependent oxidoreductase [Chelatococcus sp. SYSU_G07232]|uniref:FAD-dependent oxidoreductase n=1 Tax=Chelatococcus albus TaxID=3047466 RepID=A0ABT7AL06_9HYPH|nr:FAD-dependent oxidoreductase [Chelatococcus sp. SYSU_G07232]MDJ1160066.1 FAD-dependent oxidoreductase [Chelatococcus sp. SYSU_G07232]
MAQDFPTQARIVVIGGGIVGASVAYHLTRLGERDVVLLEQGTLSCGTTWHAAGLVGQLRSHQNMTRLIRYSTELYASLEAETGLATGWKQCGSITVARTAERMTQLKRTASAAHAQGVAIEVLTPREAGEKWPIMRTDDLVGAVWLPGDGKANPADITQALARGARTGGARILERTRVTGIRVEKGAVTAVETERGTIACEMIAICAGQWSRDIGAMCGVAIPLHSAEHMYIVTGRIDGVTPDLPVMRDPDGYVYFKEEVGGLVMGGFEPDAKPWGMEGIPHPFEFQLLPDDWDQFEILMEKALERVPALETAEIKTFLNGPESFTPDNNFILGEAPEVRNVFVAAGFNSMGIASGGGAGRALAEWIVGGVPSLDLWPVDIRRFARFNNNALWLKDRVKEVLGLHYAMPWPNRELDTARPFRRSPLYDRLATKGAVFGSKMGWERPNFFAANGEEQRIAYSFGRQNWFDRVAAEHRAAREGVAIFDMTSFAKFLMQGPDAEAVLQRLSANDVAVPVGQTVYTPLLNARGGFESDLTVARLAPDRFLILTGTAQATRDAHWIDRHIPEAARAVLTDVTSAYAVIGVMGPRSRALLQRVTRTPLDNAAFPFGAIREIGVGYATVLAARRSYMGELGWELYVPSEFAATVYETLAVAGEDLGLRDAGYYAIDSLRIEKGYRAWGRELTPDDTPWQTGMGFAVKLDKGVDFIGRAALAEAKGKPLTRRLVSFLATSPDAPTAWGGELITADGEPVGEVTSTAYGHSLGGTVGLGWVRSRGEAIDDTWLTERQFMIDVAGEPVPVRCHLKPFYDPTSARMRL